VRHVLESFRPAAWLLLGAALSCDGGGLRLVVVERSDLGAAAAGNGGSDAKAGTPSVLPPGGAAADGGSGQSSAGGTSSGGSDVDVGGGGGAPPDDTPPPFWQQPARYTASFTSHAHPEQYVRFVDDKGFIAALDLAQLTDRDSASFEMSPGLADANCISFRAVNRVGNFFRHSGSRLYMQPASDLPLYLEDATFCEEAGLADGTGVTFRSYNYRQRVIHLRNKNELWIDDIPDPMTPEFASDSTFYRQQALNETVPP
jgi:hypothetical protein